MKPTIVKWMDVTDWTGAVWHVHTPEYQKQLDETDRLRHLRHNSFEYLERQRARRAARLAKKGRA